MVESQEKIEYTPEEIEEIDRILNIISESNIAVEEVYPKDYETEESGISEKTGEPPLEATGEDEDVEDITGMIEEVQEPSDASLDDLLSPVDIQEEEMPVLDDLDSGELIEDVDTAEMPVVDELSEFEEIPEPVEIADVEDLSGIDELSGLEELSETDEMTSAGDFQEADELSGIEDLAEIEESPETEGISDIEDLPEVEEISDIEELPDLEEDSGIDELAETEELPGDDFKDIDEISDVGLEDISAEEIEPGDEEVSGEPVSTFDELEALTSEEPESVDIQDISEDAFVGVDETPPKTPAFDDEFEEIGEVEDIEDVVKTRPSDVQLGDESELDIPDLSEISLGEVKDIPEAGELDIPDIDMGGAGELGDAEISDIPDIDIGGMEEIPDTEEDIPTVFDEIELADESASRDAEEQKKQAVDDFAGKEIPDIPSIEEIDDIVDTEEIPDVDEGPSGVSEPSPAGKAPKGGLELSDRELNKLKTAIQLFHPNLRNAIRETILNDLLPAGETKKLINLIISRKPEKDIQSFLEEKLNREIDITEEVKAPGRRVITSRPEYTREGMERQKKLLKLTKVFGIAAAIAFLLTILSYQFIYKPVMAKRYINEGVAKIREHGDPVVKKVKDYQEAEELFKYVEENYIENYIYGYNSYARAYFDMREYDHAFKKLIEAKKIAPANIDTLNNLGYFYSKVPERFYNKYKPAEAEKSQLDTAIKYYKQALNVDKNNISALYGIGNAYMYQGQYFEARQYYENILKADKDAIIGYAGLLNLFIERDNFPEVLSVHSDLREEKRLSELPSALLGKLAAYYIGKKKTDDSNIRIDYGIQSPRIKDVADNPYPAVRAVLAALKNRDVNYPPLYLHYARLSHAEGNLNLMKEYLQTAINKQENYFGALHLLGEYHLLVKEPVQAYKYLKLALTAYGSPPEFTQDDFYYETESLGKTYAMIGNIFYYFFDKVKYRFGDEIEDEGLNQDSEKYANYKIARDKYTMALQEGFKSSELFYNLGRIYYMKGLFENYEKAIEYWLNLYEDFTARPELMFALGNAFYHLNNLEASKGEYLKLISIFENDAEKIVSVMPSKADHIKIFNTLSSAYNNLGAVYQRQDNEVKSSICYWKSIDYAKKIDKESELARVNMARSFKVRKEKIMPIIDENIPFSISIYSEKMR